MAYPDHSLPFIVETDASVLGLGAVLLQNQKGIERVIAYASRSLSEAESKYMPTELELAKPFEVRTDHIALRHHTTIKADNPKLIRWVLKLAPYNYTIHYKEGVENVVPDALSRLHHIDMTQGNYKEEMLKDPGYSTLYRGLLQQKDKNKEDFQDIAEEQVDLEVRWNNCTLCIPIRWGRIFTLNQHEKNHFGRTRTQNFLSDRFHWVGQTKDISTIVQSCLDCQRRKKPQLMSGPLHSIKASRKFEKVQVDLYSGIPSVMGFSAIMVTTDKKAISVARAFWNDVVAHYGPPEHIQTDRGSEFTSTFSQYYFGWISDKQTSTAFHPQSQGIMERFNRTLTDMLAEEHSSGIQFHCAYCHRLLSILFGFRSADNYWDRSSLE